LLKEWLVANRITDEQIFSIYPGAVPLRTSSLRASIERNESLTASIFRIPPSVASGFRGDASPFSANVYKIILPQGADESSAVAALSRLPNVTYAQKNFIHQPNQGGSLSESASDGLWGIDRIGAREAWSLTEGQGIIVAVVDSGVDATHPDLAPNIFRNPKEVPDNCIDDDGNGYIDDVSGYDFTSSKANERRCGTQTVYPSTIDDVGHGTHVAGTIGAVRDGQGVVGVAPRATILPVRSMNKQGGTSERLVLGLDYAVKNGARVINNSWGNDKDLIEPAIEDAVQRAAVSGVVVVFALGNNARTHRYPTFLSLDATINVGALGLNGDLAYFSNFGRDLDVVAPGEGIASTFPAAVECKAIPAPGYCLYKGTSMAAPHVAGVAALALSVNPSLRADQIRTIIKDTATDIGARGFDSSFGYGVVNAVKAVQRAKETSTVSDDVGWVRAASPLAEQWIGLDTLARGFPLEIKVSSGSYSQFKASYVPYGLKGARWSNLLARSSLGSGGVLGNIVIKDVVPGAYVLQVSARNIQTGTEVSERSVFHIDQANVFDVTSSPDVEAPKLSIDGSKIAWSEKVRSPSGGTLSTVVHLQDLVRGTQTRATLPPESDAQELRLVGNALFYSDFARTSTGNEPGLKRLDLGTGEVRIIGNCRSSLGRIDEGCISMGQALPGEQIIWSRRVNEAPSITGTGQSEFIQEVYTYSPLEGTKLLSRFMPDGGGTSLPLKSARLLGGSGLLVLKSNGQQALMSYSRATGASAGDAVATLNYSKTDAAGQVMIGESLETTDSSGKELLIEMTYRGYDTWLDTPKLVSEVFFYSPTAPKAYEIPELGSSPKTRDMLGVAFPHVIMEASDQASLAQVIESTDPATSLQAYDLTTKTARQITISGWKRTNVRVSDRFVVWVEQNPRDKSYIIRAADQYPPKPSPTPSPYLH
jgi:subtilisin family serine protease